MQNQHNINSANIDKLRNSF